MNSRQIAASFTVAVAGDAEASAADAVVLMMRSAAGKVVIVTDGWSVGDRRRFADVVIARGFTAESEIVEAASIDEIDEPDIIVFADDTPVGERERDRSGELISALAREGSQCVLIIAAPAVDRVTTQAHEAALQRGVDPSRIIGLGTVVETAHFRAELAKRIAVSREDVSAFIVGEAGENAVPLWSSATIAGTPLHLYQPKGKRPLTVRERSTILQGVREVHVTDDPTDQQSESPRDSFARPLSKALGIARVCQAILRDEHAVLTVSWRHEQIGSGPIEPVAFSLPTVVGRRGVVRVIHETPMNDAERAALNQTAARIRLHTEGHGGPQRRETTDGHR